MLSTDKPIVVEYTNNSYTNIFKEYTVQLKLYPVSGSTMQYYTMFTGRTWFDANHKTTILLSTILRDHSWRNEVAWDNNVQAYIPKRLVTGSASTPIENHSQNKFYTTNVRVQINGTTVFEKPVTVQSYSKDVEQNHWNPYDGTNTHMIEENNPYTSFISHLPNVPSENLFMGINVASWGVGTNTRLRSNGHLAIVNVGKGNHFFYLRMSYIQPIFGVSGTDEHQKVDYMVFNGSTPIGVTDLSLVLDNCPKDYYIIWDNSYGFFSWGCNGKVRGENTLQNSEYVDIVGAQKNLWNKNKYSWDLNTGMLKTDETKAFSTIADASNIWLYDTKLDKLYNVKLKTSSLKDAPANGKMENVTITVEETIQHIF